MTIPAMQASLLRGFERISVPLLAVANQNRLVKTLLQAFLRVSSGNWVWFLSKNLWEIHGLEHVSSLSPPRGVILVSNHRSFFDMYVTSAILYHYATFMGKMYFPVRSNFFYDSPLGVLVNFAVAAGTMWPPVFRDDRKALNPIGLAQMHQALEEKGAVIGIHPEGTRGKGDDPYAFLQARAGVGQLVAAAHPDTVIVPFFILGLSNSTIGEIRRNFLPEGKRGEPMRVWFGKPITAGELKGEGDPVRLSQKLMGIIGELSDQDRALHGGRYKNGRLL